MIIWLLLLQAVVADGASPGREKYEPFRKCLLKQAATLAQAKDDDRVVLEAARSNCMRVNLASGSAAMFAEIKAGATKEQAIDRVAALRLAAEQEALTQIRSIRSNGEK
ncbi:hypothetical protein [Sphingomonas sp. PB4P5]|uniref:hypothetical protein n=1 Tax=Parasphingomonas puruogangriensis TaxID=3096155 RepID=UPI002FC80839